MTDLISLEKIARMAKVEDARAGQRLVADHETRLQYGRRVPEKQDDTLGHRLELRRFRPVFRLKSRLSWNFTKRIPPSRRFFLTGPAWSRGGSSPRTPYRACRLQEALVFVSEVPTVS